MRHLSQNPPRRVAQPRDRSDCHPLACRLHDLSRGNIGIDPEALGVSHALRHGRIYEPENDIGLLTFVPLRLSRRLSVHILSAALEAEYAADPWVATNAEIDVTATKVP